MMLKNALRLLGNAVFEGFCIGLLISMLLLLFVYHRTIINDFYLGVKMLHTPTLLFVFCYWILLLISTHRRRKK